MLRISNAVNSCRNIFSVPSQSLQSVYIISRYTASTSLVRGQNQIFSSFKLFQNFSTRVHSSYDNIGILKKVLNKIGLIRNVKTKLKVSSYLLYENVADKINYLEFFNEFEFPNTFNSWFLVTELHVWMILLRAMAEGSETGDNGRSLRNNVVEAMWADVNTRAKKLGANNPSETRAQIGILSEQFQAALIAYDEGIMSDDRVLAGALWRRFFEQECNNYILLEKLVKYVRMQVQLLDSIGQEEFLFKAKIKWLDIKEL